MRLQKILHILRDTCAVCSVLSNPLPECEKEVSRIFMLKQKIYFIDEYKCLSSLRTVSCDSVENTVKDNQHSYRHQLFSKIQYVIAYEPVIGIHVCMLCKGVKRPVCKKFYRKSYLLCLGFILRKKLPVKILQCRRNSLISSALVFSVDTCSTSVYD